MTCPICDGASGPCPNCTPEALARAVAADQEPLPEGYEQFARDIAGANVDPDEVPEAGAYLLEFMFGIGPMDLAGIAIKANNHPRIVEPYLLDLASGGFVDLSGDTWQLTQRGRHAVAVLNYERRQEQIEADRRRSEKYMREHGLLLPPDPYSAPKRRRWWQREPRPAPGSFDYWQESAREAQARREASRAASEEQ